MNSMTTAAHSVYARAPIDSRNGIPIFAPTDAYTSNYEAIAEDHLKAEAATGSNPFIPEHLWQEMENSTLRLIREHARPGDRILDVGVGLGRILGQTPEFQRYGTDISLAYLERAARQGIEVCYALVEDLPYHPETFDVVTCTDVLEHVFDLNAACRNMLSVLKPDGRLIVRVPYREDLAVYAAPSCPYEFVHVRNFDEHSLRLLFEKILGARVVAMSTVGRGARPSRLGSALPAPAGKDLVSSALRGGRRLAASAYRTVARWRQQPLEINVVVKKT